MRLIDADVLREVIEDHVTTVSCCPTADWSRGKTEFKKQVLEDIDNAPAVNTEPVRQWISVKDRLPNDNVPVNVVWVNHCPAKYYSEIKDKPFTATALYFRGNWYWWDSTVEDYLAEYGYWEIGIIDSGIEITHWMPLPEPPEAD